MVRQRRALIAKGYEETSAIQVVSHLRGVRATRDVSWLRKLLGDRPMGVVFYDRQHDPTGNELRRAQQLFPEATVLEGWKRVHK